MATASPPNEKSNAISTSSAQKDPPEEKIKHLYADSPRIQREILARYGIRQHWRKRFGPPLSAAAIVIVALAMGIWVYLVSPDNIKATDVVVAVVTIGVFLIAYQQWRSTRFEGSLEKFYERLDLPNRKRENCETVLRILKNPWESAPTLPEEESSKEVSEKEEAAWSAYVYTELDNLEYVIEKYRMGYMQAYHALRGLRTFFERSLRVPFRFRARLCVRNLAYNRETIEAVEAIWGELDRRKEARRSGKERRAWRRSSSPPEREQRQVTRRIWEDRRRDSLTPWVAPGIPKRLLAWWARTRDRFGRRRRGRDLAPS